MRELERIAGTRIVARPDAIDAATWPDGTVALRLAPDEVFITSTIDAASIDDPHAIVEPETGFAGVWLDRPTAIDFLQRECDWELPATGRGDSDSDAPAFGQGLVAGLPMKIWFERERVWLIVAAPFGEDLMERLR